MSAKSYAKGDRTVTVLAVRDWRDLAACRTADPELFFPVASGGSAAGQVEEAKRVCASCPVRVECLDWALRHREGAGVWGGTTEEERGGPGAPVLCNSGRHLKNGPDGPGPGGCAQCSREYDRAREKTRAPRDQKAVYARRVARAGKEKGLAA